MREDSGGLLVRLFDRSACVRTTLKNCSATVALWVRSGESSIAVTVFERRART